MQDMSRSSSSRAAWESHVSNWRLASAVARARPGETAGTVSGTALDVVYVRLLQLGDPGGHLRRAFRAFDRQFGTTIGAKNPRPLLYRGRQGA